MKKQKIDWVIHVVMNGVECQDCNKVENSFPAFMCNVHTHGMEKYNHLDFQIVLALNPQITGIILNNMGLRVQAGETFKSGEVLSDVLADGYKVRLIETEETGRRVLRLLLPDENNNLPGDADCSYPYSEQESFVTE